MKTTIICGFPGVGKSSVRYPPNGGFNPNVLDMDAYPWIFDLFNLRKGPQRNPTFPKNYIDSLELFANVGGYEYIFLSCDAAVRAELKARGIKYIIVAPNNTEEIKNEYIKRYLRRGSDADFIDLMCREWDEMLDSIMSDPAPCIWLDSGEYLTDVLSKGLSNGYRFTDREFT